jgi:hypothetical protein
MRRKFPRSPSRRDWPARGMRACPLVRHSRHRQTRRNLLQQCRLPRDQADVGQARHVRRGGRPDEGPVPCSIKSVADGTMATLELAAVGFGRGRTGPPSRRSVQPTASSDPKSSGGAYPRPYRAAQRASASGVGHLHLSIQRSLPSRPEIRSYGGRRPAAKQDSARGRAIAAAPSHGPDGRQLAHPQASGRPVVVADLRRVSDPIGAPPGRAV